MSKSKAVKRLILYFIILPLFFYSFMKNIRVFAENVVTDEELKTNEIKNLEGLITDKQGEIDSLSGEIDKYKELIRIKQEQSNTLASQVSIMANQIVKTGLDIKRLEKQIEQLNLEIDAKKKEIKNTEEKISLQKERMAENIRTINRNDRRTNLELLLMNDKFSDFFNSLNSLKNLEDELKNIYDDLLGLKSDLDAQEKELETKKESVNKKIAQLDDQKEKLSDQKFSKEVILEQTVETEKEFRRLMSQFQQEQNRTMSQIKNLESQVKEKLEAEREKRSKQGMKNDDPTRLSWPIPNQGITTYFHDEDYPFRKWIGEHSGIDIRTLRNGISTNGIPVKAGADGVVIKIIREGKLSGNVVYILHDNDIMTVYMHLSRIDAKEDQFVGRGEMVGLSGGMPGTPGAGKISTGPHLHFEVRLNGIPVDPFNYLP